MTPRVWIERPIESVEDAEGLPEGAVAIDTDHDELAAAGNRGPGRAFIRARHWERSGMPWHNDDDGALWHDAVVGMTALVPVEAVEEESLRRVHARGSRDDLLKAQRVRRLVTNWEPA